MRGGVEMVNSFSWKEPYLAALKESDKVKLTELVYSTEGAIFQRMQEIADSKAHREERDQIQTALANLLDIQVNKLGWPSSI
jgi:hypothetical protein